MFSACTRLVPGLMAIVFLAGCSAERGPTGSMGTDPLGTKDDTPPVSGLAILGSGTHDAQNVDVQVIADASHGLSAPRDLEFNPNRPDELWIVNQADDSIVILDHAGTDQQRASHHSGSGSRHFLARPSGIAFGDGGLFATSQEEHEVTQPSTPADFMGPTLWTSDRDIFNGGHAGHMDMLHNSPDGAGIAWHSGNAYFIFDGHHQSLTYYNFQDDHGPGGADHSDGVVLRFAEGDVSYVPGVPSHMEVARDSGLLYVADSGNNRIAVLDPQVGDTGDAIRPNYDGIQQFEMLNADLRTLVDGAMVGLERPSGLALHDGLLFVSDNATSAIAAFDLEGNQIDSLSLAEHFPAGSLMGIAFDAAGDLYAVDGVENRVLRVRPLEADRPDPIDPIGPSDPVSP